MAWLAGRAAVAATCGKTSRDGQQVFLIGRITRHGIVDGIRRPRGPKAKAGWPYGRKWISAGGAASSNY